MADCESAVSQSGLISAPRIPQAWQTNLGSMSNSLNSSGQRSAGSRTRWLQRWSEQPCTLEARIWAKVIFFGRSHRWPMPRRSRDLTHVRSQVLTLVVRTDEQAAGWWAVEAGRWRGWRAEVSSGPEPAVDPMVANEGRAAGPLSRPSAAGGGGRRPALTGPAARPSSSTEVDCGRALGRRPVEQLHQGVSAA
jgi:hypothetical protein